MSLPAGPRFALVAAAALSLSACGINSIPTAEENAKAKWGDVQAAFQERANLVPNLAAVAKGAANQEKSILTSVIEARSKATSIQLAPGDLSDPAKVKAFQDAPDAYAFGVDVNQCPQAPGVVMDNVEKKTDVAVELAIKGISAGTQQPVTALGLSEGGMAFTGLDADVKASQCKIAAYPDAIAKVKALRDQIVSGAIKIADPMTAK